MSKICEIVRDLLPLYVDGACSPASVEMIEEHIESCPTCRDMHDKMKRHTDEDALREEKDGVIVRHEKRESRKLMRLLLSALSLIYFPVILILPVFLKSDGGFISTPYIFDLLLLFLCTFPCYLAVIELGGTLCGIWEKRITEPIDRIFHTIGAVLSCLILLLTIDLADHLLYSLALAVLLLISRICFAVIRRERPALPAVLRQRSFWVCSLVIFLIVLAVMFVSSVLMTTRNVREETVETAVAVEIMSYGAELDGVYLEAGADERMARDLIGREPRLTVCWVNESAEEIRVDRAFSLYRQTDEGWTLYHRADPTDPAVMAEVAVRAQGGRVRQTYPLDGCTIESGRYRFVTNVDGCALWMEFGVTITQYTK